MDLNRVYSEDYLPQDIVAEAASVGISARTLLDIKKAVLAERARCAMLVESLLHGPLLDNNDPACDAVSDVISSIRKGE